MSVYADARSSVFLPDCRPHLSASPPVPSFVPAEDVVPGPATAHSNYTDELGIVIYQTLEARSGPPQLRVSARGHDGGGGLVAVRCQMDDCFEVEVSKKI